MRTSVKTHLRRSRRAKSIVHRYQRKVSSNHKSDRCGYCGFPHKREELTNYNPYVVGDGVCNGCLGHIRNNDRKLFRRIKYEESRRN